MISRCVILSAASAASDGWKPKCTAPASVGSPPSSVMASSLPWWRGRRTRGAAMRWRNNQTSGQLMQGLFAATPYSTAMQHRSSRWAHPHSCGRHQQTWERNATTSPVLRPRLGAASARNVREAAAGWVGGEKKQGVGRGGQALGQGRAAGSGRQEHSVPVPALPAAHPTSAQPHVGTAPAGSWTACAGWPEPRGRRGPATTRGSSWRTRAAGCAAAAAGRSGGLDRPPGRPSRCWRPLAPQGRRPPSLQRLL